LPTVLAPVDLLEATRAPRHLNHQSHSNCRGTIASTMQTAAAATGGGEEDVEAALATKHARQAATQSDLAATQGDLTTQQAMTGNKTLASVFTIAAAQARAGPLPPSRYAAEAAAAAAAEAEAGGGEGDDTGDVDAYQVATPVWYYDSVDDDRAEEDQDGRVMQPERLDFVHDFTDCIDRFHHRSHKVGTCVDIGGRLVVHSSATEDNGASK